MSDDQQREREYFAFFHSYRNAVARLKKKDQLPALWAIINYGLDGLLPDDNDNENALAVFYAVVPNIDASRRLSKARSDAGAKGGRPKKANEKQTKANESKPKANESKLHEEEVEGEVEVKEKIQKKEFAPHVHLTEAEHSTLIAKHGANVVAWCIDKLDSYKESSGKTYKSDAGAIRQWVLSAYEKEHPQANNRTTDDIVKEREQAIADDIEEIRRTHPEAQIL